MALGLLSFCIVFLSIASGGLLLTRQDVMARQVSTLNSTFRRKKSLSGTMRQAADSLGAVVGRFDGILPKSKAEVSAVQLRMVRAGYRKDSAVQIFYGTKFLLMVVFVVLAVVTGLASLNYLIVILVALALGFLAPDFWLGRQISKRQKQIRLGLPDLLDLLIVCVEAGLSLDQATSRTTEELDKSHSVISDELGMVVLEQRAGRPRIDAWKNFAERTDVSSVRNVVSMLVQSEQFGTSIAKTLRVHSETLRTQRVQQVEEQAAKTSIKMLIPLVLLIFPSIFLVTLGPAVILMMESFGKNFSH